jgi:hypothetical protein
LRFRCKVFYHETDVAAAIFSKLSFPAEVDKMAVLNSVYYKVSQKQERIEMSLPQSVLHRVQRDFSPEECDEILQILSFYGTEDYEREEERVLLAVLKLSKGSIEAVWDYVDRAKKDYRDILFWSEYPEESRLDTAERIAQFRNLCEWLGIDIGLEKDNE